VASWSLCGSFRGLCAPVPGPAGTAGAESAVAASLAQGC